MKNNSRLGKIAFASALVAASGGAALGLTSIASASLGSSPSVSPTAEPTAAPAHDTDQNNDDGQQADGRGEGHHRGPRLITENLAKVLKLSVEELRTQLMSGKTITQIADAQNVDIDDVKAVIVSDAEARLAEAVKDGKMTQDEADAKLTELKSKVDEIVTKVPQRRGDGPRDHSHSPESGSNSSDGASFSA